MPDFHRVGSVGDFSEGLVRVFPVQGIDVGVVLHEGRFHAFLGKCPHAGYVMNYTRIRPGDRILCSSHMAWFDLHTGKVLEGPTDQDLDLYDVKVEGDDVLVSVDAG
ncbi:MAG TPA: Rieske (2Fe-2S) protein [Dehalococcoidia bacterium]|jgi:3-phenylpropionate/trans-cinnamate dioxygenase ferredoxin subunit|nr:Rieske (2Fe-2S) protein [Dehalococcoidia bacterium]